MDIKKKLLVLSLAPNVHEHLVRVLSGVLGDFLQIQGCTFNDYQPTKKLPDAVLISGAFLHEKVKSLFSKIPIIVPERVIFGKNLEQVARLPKGTKVLVFTSHKDATQDTIKGLERLGLDHLKYIPFESGSTENLATEIAITPGLHSMIPLGITKLIDIGDRLISMYSFLKVLITLDLDFHYLEQYADNYHRSVADSTIKLVEALESLEIKQMHEKIILEEFDDGIVSINQDGKVEIANRAALKILETTHEQIVNQPYAKISKSFNRMATLIGGNGDGKRNSSIYDNKGNQLVQTTIPVHTKHHNATIIILREIDSIQKIEEDVRLGLHQKGFVAKYRFNDIVTESHAFRRLLEKSKRFAKTTKNILITGESGTGKELVAHAIHRESPQSNGPFVAVNFAGIAESLVESELFGYTEGAFTGASRGGKKGLFEYAHGGTIFLDEIGDASPALQARLLRVLQEKEIRRVGGTRIIPVSVRVIAATNTDLTQAIIEKTFRKDLFYRLSTLPIHILPLRDRKEDIMLLLNHYLKNSYNINKKYSSQATTYLLNHTWPGNIRELLNIAEYVCFSSEGRQVVELEDFPPYLFIPTNKEEVNGLEAMDFPEKFYAAGLNPELIIAILAQIEKYNFQGVGRQRLKKDLASIGIDISEAVLRRTQLKMRQMGLVQIGSTRQGTTLSSEGRKMLLTLSK